MEEDGIMHGIHVGRKACGIDAYVDGFTTHGCARTAPRLIPFAALAEDHTRTLALIYPRDQMPELEGANEEGDTGPIDRPPSSPCGHSMRLLLAAAGPCAGRRSFSLLESCR